MLKFGVKITSIKAAYLQGIGSAAGHNLPHIIGGLLTRIKDTSASGSDPSSIGEYKYLNIVTSFNRNIISLPNLYLVLYPRSHGHGLYVICIKGYFWLSHR